MELKQFEENFSKIRDIRNRHFVVYDENEDILKDNIFKVLMNMDECFFYVESFILKFGYCDFSFDIISYCFERFLKDCLKGYEKDGIEIKDIERIRFNGGFILFRVMDIVICNVRSVVYGYFSILKRIESGVKSDIVKLIDDFEEERNKKREELKKLGV